jgi:hypothetical protein
MDMLAKLAKAMSRTRLRLTARSDMWLAWMGFNFSHSLGVLLLGAVVLVIGRSTTSFEAEGRIFVPLSIFVSALYLLGSARSRRQPVAQAKARSHRDRRRETHARRHDADALPHSRSYAGHDIDSHSGEAGLLRLE